jgi:hypothetical protein
MFQLTHLLLFKALEGLLSRFKKMHATVSILQDQKSTPGLRNPFKYFQTKWVSATFAKYLPYIEMGVSNKINSAEDGIVETNCLSDGILSIPRNRKLSEFRSEPFHGREKIIGILCCRPKIEANSQNSIPNHSAEEKTIRNSVSWNKTRNKLSEFCSEAFHYRKHALNSVC